jgi:hypothetical protein
MRLAGKHGELLTEGEILKEKIVPAAQGVAQERAEQKEIGSQGLGLHEGMVPQGWSICLIPSTVWIRMTFCHPTANTMMKSCARRLSLRKALRPRLRLVLQS